MPLVIWTDHKDLVDMRIFLDAKASLWTTNVCNYVFKYVIHFLIKTNFAHMKSREHQGWYMNDNVKSLKRYTNKFLKRSTKKSLKTFAKNLSKYFQKTFSTKIQKILWNQFLKNSKYFQNKSLKIFFKKSLKKNFKKYLKIFKKIKNFCTCSPH